MVVCAWQLSEDPGNFRVRLCTDFDFISHFHLGKEFFQIGAVHANAAMRGSLADRVLYVGSMDPIALGAEADPASSDRKSTRLNSSHSQISYAVFCSTK